MNTGGPGTFQIVLGLCSTTDIAEEEVVGVYTGAYCPETHDDGKDSTGDEPSAFPQYNLDLATRQPFNKMYIDIHQFQRVW